MTKVKRTKLKIPKHSKDRLKEIEKIQGVLTALSSPIRFNVMELVAKNDSKGVTPSQIMEVYPIEPTLLSHHLAFLVKKEMLTWERQGKTRVYFLNVKLPAIHLDFLEGYDG